MPDPRLDADERDWPDAHATVAELRKLGFYSSSKTQMADKRTESDSEQLLEQRIPPHAE